MFGITLSQCMWTRSFTMTELRQWRSNQVAAQAIHNIDVAVNIDNINENKDNNKQQPTTTTITTTTNNNNNEQHYYAPVNPTDEEKRTGCPRTGCGLLVVFGSHLQIEIVSCKLKLSQVVCMLQVDTEHCKQHRAQEVLLWPSYANKDEPLCMSKAS